MSGLAFTPHPQPFPTRGRGGAGFLSWFRSNAALGGHWTNILEHVPPLPLVGRGWGWGATARAA